MGSQKGSADFSQTVLMNPNAQGSVTCCMIYGHAFIVLRNSARSIGPFGYLESVYMGALSIRGKLLCYLSQTDQFVSQSLDFIEFLSL